MADHLSMLPALLSAIRRDLDGIVAPELASAEARTTAAMISELLAYLTVWQRDMPGQVAPLTRSQADALASLDALDLPRTATLEDGELDSDIPGGLPDYDRLARALDRELATLDTATLDAAAIPAIEKAVGADLMLFDREASLLGGEREQASSRLASSDPRVSAERLTVFAREVFPADIGAEVSGVTRLSGFGLNDVFRLTLTSGIGRSRDLVLRRDPPIRLGTNGAAEEFRLLSLLSAAGFPVAEPLWLEADSGVLGRPFMLSAAVEGTADLDEWSGDEEARAEVPLALARMLGRLHGLDRRVLLSAGLRPDADPAEQLRAAIASWRDRWLEYRPHPSPTLQAAFQWLLGHVPPRRAPAALIHGDLDQGNVLVRDGRIAAVLDWEFAHLGDPAEDLVACRSWIETLLPWGEFVAAYQSAGGRPPGEESLQFCALWREVRSAVCCSLAWRAFLDGTSPVLRLAYQGIPLYRRHVREAAEQLRGLWAHGRPATALDPVERTHS